MKSFNQLIRHNGNRNLFKAVEMAVAAIMNERVVHIHAQGLRGTGKTTIMRSIKEMLPPIVRIKGCLYNCHPHYPHCPMHNKMKYEEIEKIGIEYVQRPFLEISQSAKISTVVGSIDLQKLTDQQKMVAAILPGTIPQAHRGIIFIDEINRIADTSPEIADVLLDVMGTKPGRIQIEEIGLPSVELPLSVSVWAASNPDENPGPLNRVRRQLSDRFDFTIEMARPDSYESVFRILTHQHDSGSEMEDLLLRTKKLDDIVIEEAIKNVVAKIYVDFRLESLRAIEAIETGSVLAAFIAQRSNVLLDDVASVIPFALNHRTNKETILAILQYITKLGIDASGDHVDTNLSKEESLKERTSKERQEISWWRRFIYHCYEKLSFLSMKRSLNGVSHQSSMVSPGSIKLKNPSDNISAPGQKALPLKELPLEKIVRWEEDDHS